MGAHRRDIKAIAAEVTTGCIADGDDSTAHVGQERGGNPADVPEALDDDFEIVEILLRRARPLAHHQADALAGRLAAPL